MEKPPIAVTALLDEQAARLNQLATHIRDFLQKTNITVPASLQEEVSRVLTLSSQLKSIVLDSEHSELDLHALFEIGQLINSTHHLDDVLRIVMDTIIRLLNAERGFLMLNKPTGEIDIQVARNWEQETVHETDFAISRTIVNQAISDCMPILTTNALDDPRFSEQDSILTHNLRSIICVPLVARGQCIGAIYADNRIQAGVFTKQDISLLEAFSNQAAVAIENAKLFESLRDSLAEATELKRLMENVFSSIASGVITSDQDLIITTCNPAVELILSRSRQELIGQSLINVLAPLGNEFIQHIHHVQATNQNLVGLEFEPTFPSRGAITISLNISPLTGSNRNIEGLVLVFDDITERRRLQKGQRLFERMVSPAVISKLNHDQIEWGGERRVITTLFIDIRGFTSFGDRRTPEQVVTVLNRYLASAAEAILEFDGTIDKFMGDAVMAWFNAPIPQPDHAARAVKAALRVRELTDELQHDLPADFHLSFGSGIHYGEAVLGLVGTEKRVEYTAIGDSINTAKRIQETASANQILISADTYALVASLVEARSVGAIPVKGKSLPLSLYELICLK